MKILLLSNDLRLEDEHSISLFNLIVKTSTDNVEWVNFSHYYDMKHPDFGNILKIDLNNIAGNGVMTIYPFNLLDVVNSPKLFNEVYEEELPDLIMVSTNDLTKYDWIFSDDKNINILNNTPVIVYNSWIDLPLVYGFKPYYEFADKILTMNYMAHTNAKLILGKRAFNKKVNYLPPNINTNVFNGNIINNDLNKIFKNTSKFNIIAENHPRNIEVFTQFIQTIGHSIRKQIRLIIIDGNDTIVNYLRNNLLDKLNIIPITKQLSDNDLNYLFSMSDLYIDNKPLNDLSYNTLKAISCSTPIVVNNTGANIDYSTDYNLLNRLSKEKPYPTTVKTTSNSILVEKGLKVLQTMYKNQMVYSTISDDNEFIKKMNSIYKNKHKTGELRAKAIQYFDTDVISSKLIAIINDTVDNFEPKSIKLPLVVKNSYKGIKNNMSGKYI